MTDLHSRQGSTERDQLQVMTERYAHLRPDLFSARDLATIDLDLNASEPDPGPSGTENGHEMASPRQLPGRIHLKLRKKCRSRPVSRGRNTVGMGRFPERRGAPRGRKHWSERDWRRRGVRSHAIVRQITSEELAGE
jgi:hypothetical protein